MELKIKKEGEINLEKKLVCKLPFHILSHNLFLTWLHLTPPLPYSLEPISLLNSERVCHRLNVSFYSLCKLINIHSNICYRIYHVTRMKLFICKYSLLSLSFSLLFFSLSKEIQKKKKDVFWLVIGSSFCSAEFKWQVELLEKGWQS